MVLCIFDISMAKLETVLRAFLPLMLSSAEKQLSTATLSIVAAATSISHWSEVIGG